MRNRSGSTPTCVAVLEKFIPLAPLHQPHNLAPIRRLLERRPDLPQVACFDTAFHAHQSRHLTALRHSEGAARCRGAALRLSRPVLRVRRLARCRSTMRVPRQARPSCAISATARACARSRAARSVASTMGFTAVDGLPMGTRCGRHRSRRAAVPHGSARHGRARDREAHLQPVGPARRFRHLERHAQASRVG